MKKINLACIVDDDPLHLYITKKYIELSNIVENVLVFKNGKEAYDSLKQMLSKSENLPEIIFLDLNMPVWDGWQFVDEFTKLTLDQKVSICILSSSNSEEDMERAKHYSIISKYLVKPTTESRMKEILVELSNPSVE